MTFKQTSSLRFGLIQLTTHSHDSPLLGYFALFGSLATLVCCALPSLLVVLGLGSAVISLVSSAPWLVSLSRNKAWVFVAAGALIAANFWYVHVLSSRLRARGSACASDDPRACDTAHRVSRAMLWTAAAVYAVAAVTALTLGPLLAWFER